MIIITVLAFHPPLVVRLRLLELVCKLVSVNACLTGSGCRLICIYQILYHLVISVASLYSSELERYNHTVNISSKRDKSIKTTMSVEILFYNCCVAFQYITLVLARGT